MAIAVSATVVLNGVGHRTGPEVRQFVRLAAQAAVVPVPRPLPIDSSSALIAAPPNAAADTPIAVAPDHFTGPAPAAVAPPARLQALPVANTGESGTWAVVVGINDYPGTSNDLRYAVNDANDAAQALSLQGVSADHVVNLRDGQVSADVLRSSIRWLTAHAGPDAVAVFFYAGHVQKLRGAEAIVTSNGATVTDSELAGLLRPLAARRAWITIAACYGGGFTELLAPGRVLTAAAGANDAAYESSAFGRSYLGEYMIHRAMIEGAANDSVQSAFSWANARLSQEYPGRAPVEYDNGDGRLILRPAGASASSQPAQSSPPPADTQPAPSSPPPDPDPGTPPPKKCSGSGLIRFC